METIEAKDLQFGDTIWFEGEYHHVIEAVLNTDQGVNVYMSPTDGLGLDRHLSFPQPFTFYLYTRI